MKYQYTVYFNVVPPLGAMHRSGSYRFYAPGVEAAVQRARTLVRQEFGAAAEVEFISVIRQVGNAHPTLRPNLSRRSGAAALEPNESCPEGRAGRRAHWSADDKQAPGVANWLRTMLRRSSVARPRVPERWLLWAVLASCATTLHAASWEIRKTFSDTLGPATIQVQVQEDTASAYLPTYREFRTVATITVTAAHGNVLGWWVSSFNGATWSSGGEQVYFAQQAPGTVGTTSYTSGTHLEAVSSTRYFVFEHQANYAGGSGTNIAFSDKDSWQIGTLVTTYKTTFKYFNDKPYPVTLNFMKDGTSIGTRTIDANTTFSYTFTDLAENVGTYQVLVQKSGLSYTGDGSWVAAADSVVHTAQTSVVPNTNVIPSTTTTTTANTTTIPTTTNLPSSLPTASTSSSVWRTPTVTGNNTTDALTNATFREGIDKVTDRQDKQIARDKEVKDAEAAAKSDFEAKSASSTLQTVVDAKLALVKDAVSANISGGGVSTPTVPASSSALSFTIAGEPVNLLPTGVILTGFTIMKLLIQTILIFGWIYYMQKEMRDVLKTVGVAPQSRGNTLAGSGGQITAAIAASLFTLLLLGVPVAMAALADNGIGWKQTVDFFSAFTEGGATGEGALVLMSQAFPILTFAAIMNNIIIFKVGGTIIMSGAVAAARWIVPALAVGLYLVSADQADAAVTWRNQSDQAISVETLSGVSVFTSLSASSVVTAGAVRGSAYRVTRDGDGVTRVVEVLDEGEVCVMPDGSLSVVHSTACWGVYLGLGFVTGCLWEIGGWVFRRFASIGGSLEVPS